MEPAAYGARCARTSVVPASWCRSAADMQLRQPGRAFGRGGCALQSYNVPGGVHLWSSSSSSRTSMTKNSRPAAKTPAKPRAAVKAAARNTDSGPASVGSAMADLPSQKMLEVEQLAAQMPSNPNKPLEHGLQAALQPPRGATAQPPSRVPLGSTLSEDNGSEKTGSVAPAGVNATIEPLDRVRVDSSGQVLTTNLGVAVSDNQNSLKYGLRGPALLEDFVLREKITHFDHERIPERIVHARGSAAHGFFECYDPLTKYTRAAPFQEKGKVTPVFVRFSTVAGERGSKDTARD